MAAKPKQISVTDDVSSEFDYCSLATIQANVLELIVKYGPDASIWIESEDYYGSTSIRVRISYLRMQTQEEADKEEAQNQTRLLQRKQAYLNLKKEFES